MFLLYEYQNWAYVLVVFFMSRTIIHHYSRTIIRILYLLSLKLVLHEKTINF